MTWEGRLRIFDLAASVLLRSPQVDSSEMSQVESVLLDPRLFTKMRGVDNHPKASLQTASVAAADGDGGEREKKNDGSRTSSSDVGHKSESENGSDDEWADATPDADTDGDVESKLLFSWLTGLRLYRPGDEACRDAWTDLAIELADQIDDVSDAAASLSAGSYATANEAHLRQVVALRETFSMNEFAKITQTFAREQPLAHWLCLDTLHTTFGDEVVPRLLNTLVQCRIVSSLSEDGVDATKLSPLGWRPWMAEQCIRVCNLRGAELPEFLQPEAEQANRAQMRLQERALRDFRGRS